MNPQVSSLHTLGGDRSPFFAGTNALGTSSASTDGQAAAIVMPRHGLLKGNCVASDTPINAFADAEFLFHARRHCVFCERTTEQEAREGRGAGSSSTVSVINSTHKKDVLTYFRSSWLLWTRRRFPR